MIVNNYSDGGCSGGGGSSAPPAAPGHFKVRAWYIGLADGGHVYDEFTTRERAEQAMIVLASRANVLKAAIETTS